jgi:hydroxymethylpyrimidine pyrophosphatase-like HAD family hydrolase
MIKLLALDLDGRCSIRRVDSGTEPRSDTGREEAGVLVTIATGSRFRDARPLGLELELNAPLVYTQRRSVEICRFA